MSELQTKQILREREVSSYRNLAFVILSVISALLSIVYLASVIGVYYAFGLSVIGYVLLLSIFHMIFRPDVSPIGLFDTFRSEFNKTIDADTEYKIQLAEDENPVYIGGRNEPNFTDREDRKIKPGEKVILRRKSREEISVEGAITDTISTGGGTFIKVEEMSNSFDNITHVNLARHSDEDDTDTDSGVGGDTNTEAADDSMKDSGVSPVVGVILMIAVAIVVISVITIVFILGAGLFESELQILKQYAVPLAIVSFVGPLIFRYIKNMLENADEFTEVSLERYVDSNGEDQGDVVTVDIDNLHNKKYIAVPNDSNPLTWEQESTLSDRENKIHFFLDVVDSPQSVEVDGKAIHPINQYGPCNAKYDTLEKITIYNTEYEELFSVSVPN